ncbi:hypothetical protein F0562_016481 [Nyssa sinensis]|uniref:Cyclic nucleotide-binding domain-containing protein n=1 Tax=Nyssa sinensis TaxID=561372 RepID=A0A5J4ZJE1_9ASTE|nr:hypothetical protein F0562_016481 [Nyssa sinensis]
MSSSVTSFRFFSLTPQTLSLSNSKPAPTLLSLFSFSSSSLNTPLKSISISTSFLHSSVSPIETSPSQFVRNVAVSSDLDQEEEVLKDEEEPSFSPAHKLFVGNLPFSVDSAALAGLFERAGNVEMVEVIYDKQTGRSRGFGFVTMSSVAEVEAAAQQFNGYELDGRALRVNSGPPPQKEELSFRGARGGSGTRFDNTNRVYVGNLSWDVDDLALETLFSEKGKVMEVKVVYDRDTGRSRGFGFVTYSSANEVNNAVESLNGIDLNGRPIRIEMTTDVTAGSMDFGHSKSIRFQDDLETENLTPPRRDSLSKLMYMINGKQTLKSFLKKTRMDATGKPFQEKELTRVFSEDYEVVQRKILDPRGPDITRWNKCFLVACLISLFIDPLFFYLPRPKAEGCMGASMPLKVVLTVIRTGIDAFYMIQIFVRFRTAYVAPSSRVFGRGELVIDPSKIASRYLRKDFWLDLLAALPFPQFLLRLYLIFPLSSQITKATGVVIETPWAGAAYNLMLYMLASHVIGSCWYLLAIERQEQCWKKVCNLQLLDCRHWFLDCHSLSNSDRNYWFNLSNISTLCDPSHGFFQFGIYAEALTFEVTSSKFFSKYTYCLWWGLRSLSSMGQNLVTSTYISEINFAIIIAILGLVLFALLIGNMQTYLQSTTMRLEEWRIRRMDTEQWMHHRQLPHELKESVRKYDQYAWIATRGVDEEAILKGLPLDLRRDIKRHLCLDLVRRVPIFDQMDEHMLEAICERLKPVLCTPGTCLVREGDPVNEMLFIIRGYLDSYTTNGGRTGFFNSCRIGPGDLCGEELLTWALDPRSSAILPSSTRTVKAISEVEAFALVAEDVKFVASQFRKLHSKQLRHTFRFYSPQWRTWAACFIQAAWFRYKRRKEAAELKAMECSISMASLPEAATKQMSTPLPPLASELAMYAVKLAASTRRGGSMRCGSELDLLNSLQKPVEPDFSVEDSNYAEDDMVMLTSTISDYSLRGEVDHARNVFDKMGHRDSVSWNVMIKGYIENNRVGDARALFDEMPEKSSVSWNSMIMAYAKERKTHVALKLFVVMPDKDVVSWTAIVTALCRDSRIEDAWHFFKQMPEPNSVSWSSIISGFQQNRFAAKTLSLFKDMLLAGVQPTSHSITSALAASADLAMLSVSEQFYAQLLKRGFDCNTHIGNSAISMFIKSGSFDNARRVFVDLHEPDLVTWNSMIMGYGQHGYGREAVMIFHQMQKAQFLPDYISFLGVLHGCSHCGFVEEGEQYFRSMEMDSWDSTRT